MVISIEDSGVYSCSKGPVAWAPKTDLPSTLTSIQAVLPLATETLTLMTSSSFFFAFALAASESAESVASSVPSSSSTDSVFLEDFLVVVLVAAGVSGVDSGAEEPQPRRRTTMSRINKSATAPMPA